MNVLVALAAMSLFAICNSEQTPFGQPVRYYPALDDPTVVTAMRIINEAINDKFQLVAENIVLATKQHVNGYVYRLDIEATAFYSGKHLCHVEYYQQDYPPRPAKPIKTPYCRKESKKQE